MKDVFAITAAILNGCGYLLYFSRIWFDKKFKPNSASWAMWAVLATVDFLSYEKLSGGVVSSSIFLVDSAWCVIIFFYLLMAGGVSWPNSKEWVSILLGAFAAVVLFKYHDAVFASLIIASAATISFRPLFGEIKEGKSTETPLVWWIWTLAFIVMVFNVFNRRGEVIEYVAPITFLALHLRVAIFVTKNRKWWIIN